MKFFLDSFTRTMQFNEIFINSQFLHLIKCLFSCKERRKKKPTRAFCVSSITLLLQKKFLSRQIHGRWLTVCMCMRLFDECHIQCTYVIGNSLFEGNGNVPIDIKCTTDLALDLMSVSYISYCFT